MNKTLKEMIKANLNSSDNLAVLKGVSNSGKFTQRELDELKNTILGEK